MNVSKKSIQYPPQTGLYKVFVKDKSKWRDYSTARLQISVGNPKHTGDKFFALTEWAAARFDKVILIVSDTLQRHNLALQQGIALEEAYQVSLLNGQRWLRENKAALDTLSPSQKVLTLWDHWMAHPGYVASRQEIDRIFCGNPSFKDAVQKKAEEFCLRTPGADAFVQQRNLETSLEYILEEIAAFAVMFRETQAIDVYPGAWFKEVFDVLAQEEISELMSGFSSVESVRVDFTRNKRPPDHLPLFLCLEASNRP